jgi:signal transduction histidine kinase
MKKAVPCGSLAATFENTLRDKQFDLKLACSHVLRTIRLWFLRNSFSPTWLPIRKFRQPIGYIVAILVQLLAVFLDSAFKYYFFRFPFPSILTVCGAGFVALSWGIGPGMVSLIWGTFLLDYLIITPAFSFAGKSSYVASLVVLLIAGIAIVALTSQLVQNHQRALATNQRMIEFLNTASHELRTPLTGLAASVQLAQRRIQKTNAAEDRSSDDLRHCIQQIDELLAIASRQIWTQDRLVRDMLDSVRVQVRGIDIHRQDVDLSSLVAEVVEEIRMVDPARQIALQMSPQEEIPVLADKVRVSQVVANYLTNAIKYSPAHQPIEVTVHRGEKQARVAVRDYGHGLTPYEQERIWERFYRAATTQDMQTNEGLGLGLYICKLIIQGHQGRLGVDSHVGKGSTFWFTLPLAK